MPKCVLLQLGSSLGAEQSSLPHSRQPRLSTMQAVGNTSGTLLLEELPVRGSFRLTEPLFTHQLSRPRQGSWFSSAAWCFSVTGALHYTGSPISRAEQRRTTSGSRPQLLCCHRLLPAHRTGLPATACCLSPSYLRPHTVCAGRGSGPYFLPSQPSPAVVGGASQPALPGCR